MLQPIFRGGELTARRRAAIAAYDQAEAQYRETVLQAFQNVADVLRALEKDAQTLKAQADAEAVARASLDLTRKQFQLGAVSYLTLLNAERQHQQARISLVQAQAARFADTAALFQALGGGWWKGDRLTMKKRILFAILGLVILIAVLAAVKAMQIRAMIDQGKKFVPPPETVTSAVARAESWETALTAVGSLTAVQGVTVAAELAGKVGRDRLRAGGEGEEGGPVDPPGHQLGRGPTLRAPLPRRI